MKRSNLLVLFLAVLFVLPCYANAQDSRLNIILKRGKLIVGTTGHYPPFTVESKKGTLMGIDMDLAELFAKAMGVKAEIKKMPIDDLLPAVEKGKVDMALAGLTITPQRNLRVMFVGPYFVIGQSLLTDQDKVEQMKGPDDINRPDFRLGVAQGTTGAEVAKSLAPKAKLVSAQNMEQALEMLLAGKLDAIMADQPFCIVAAFLNREKKLAASDPFTFEPIGVALPAGDAQFLNWIENFLMILEANGQLKELKQFWFSDPGWMDNLPENMRGKRLYQPVI